MRMCKNHWDRLKKEIDHLGLLHLSAKDEEEVAQLIIDGIEEGPTKENFDPLMDANFAIFNQFLVDVGLEGLGEYCPLCEVSKTRIGLDENWIKGSCQDALDKARYFGLVPEVQ